MTPAPIITLTTDFGHQDAYVAIMKGVILKIAPSARLVDVSHEIAPQDISAGAFLLESLWPYFPDTSIHVAVVDPGVGTSRRPIAVRTARGVFIGPDNGLLAPALVAQRVVDPSSGAMTGGYAVVLENPAYRRPIVSSTFHGRDIFAPAAAHLAIGTALEHLGSRVRTVALADALTLQLRTDTSVGVVQHVDRFGNLITNLPASAVPPTAEICVGGLVIAGLSLSYQERSIGALIGSSGLLEIGVRNGNAAQTLGIGRGAEVVIRVPE